MATFRSIGTVINHITKLQSRSVPATRFLSTKKDGKDKCEKMSSTLPGGKKSKQKCDKVKGVGCAPKARENCDNKPKIREPCDRLQVPQASFSECVKDPPPWHGMSECPTEDKGPPLHCLTPKLGVSIDGCNPPPKRLPEPDCRPRNVGPKVENKPCDPCDVTQKKPFKGK